MPLYHARLSRPRANKAVGDNGDKPQSDKERAQLRRAQVRRAQIQHRERKANYIKQLELDVSEIRDLIALSEKETAALFKENYLIREALENVGIATSTTPAGGFAKSPV